jgi:hypothetical protein
VPARVSAAAVALLLLAAGCGGESRRDAVADYVREVNVVAAELDAPSRAVVAASGELAKENVDAVAVERKLLRAASGIERVRARLARLEAPPEARRLRALLLELATREASLAREVAALAAFLPAYAEALSPLAAAGAKLKAALAHKGPVAATADALDAYGDTVAVVLARLRALKPPPVSAALHTTQTQSLAKVRWSAAALARALRERRAAAIPGLVQRLNRAAISNQTLAAQRARIGAVRAYNARVRTLDELSIRITRERARLEEALE